MKFMQIKPQKARGVFKESLWTDPAWSAETKFDGDRRIAQFCWPQVRFTGTRESVDGTGYVEKSANLPHLGGGAREGCLEIGEHWPLSPKALEGTVLDGEIIAPWASKLPGGESKWVTSIMGSIPERAVALQRERGWLEYMVFDCLWYKGEDKRSCSLSVRRAFAQSAISAWNNKHARLVEFSTSRATKKAAWGEAREGLVFKHQDHTYGDQNLWVKLKKSWTADVVVMGFEKGKGKYSDTIGAIVFGQYIPGTVTGHAAPGKVYLTKMGTCSGFTDDLRDDLDKSYIGRVIEIAHNGREPTGAFRHPRFKRFRPDKSPKDCVFREDET